MAKNKGVESILAKVGASEALKDDDFVPVCCKDAMISVRRAYVKFGICCIVRRNTIIYGRTVNQDSMAILQRGHIEVVQRFACNILGPRTIVEHGRSVGDRSGNTTWGVGCTVSQ